MKFSTLITFILLFSKATMSQYSLLSEEFSHPDFSTPAHIGSHVFNFFHHSSGGNLLNDGLADALQNLGYTLHSCLHTQYEYENNFTDYRHWYKRFQRELGVKVGDHYYRYEGPDQNGTPIIGEQIDDDYQDFMLNYYEYHAELMDIIMFKPCYPGSDLTGYDTQFDGNTNNNGFGNVTSGTPHADNGNNNFSYLNSGNSVDDIYTDSHWTYGYWDGPNSSLAQLKCAYRGLLNIFVQHPDILFIAMQAPPMVYLSDEAANSCREFARWLREDWLHQYDPKGMDSFENYPLKNVVPFDFHNAIAWTGEETSLDNEYFWFKQGGMPDNAMDSTDPAKIGRSASSEDHPENWLNQRTTMLFCGGVDSFSPPFTGKSAQTYYCWINAAVNRWEKASTPVPVELVSLTGSQKDNFILLQWSTAAESSNLGFEIQRKLSHEKEFEKITFVRGHATTATIHNYQYLDINVLKGKYDYRLKQVDFDGSFEFTETITVTVELPKKFELWQNFPNPFNACTKICYQLTKPSQVKLIVLDVTGKTISDLLNQRQLSGRHQIAWDGKNDLGVAVSSGVYFYRLWVDNDYSAMNKMILIR